MMGSFILSMKVFVISVCVVSLAVGVKLAVPIAVNGIPALFSVIVSLLKPPYLYLIINGIIFTIAASSRFHRDSELSVSVKPALPVDFEPQLETPAAAVAVFVASETEATVGDELKHVIEDGSKEIAGTQYEEDKATTDVHVGDGISDLKLDGNGSTSPEIVDTHVKEKPLLSSRFNYKKPIRSSPEGMKALKVARPKRQETVESTWKMIMDGRHVPLTRHQKKIDSHVPRLENRTSLDRPAHRIRKEPSLGQDELNRRVEAFIKKFNEDMILQRQESLRKYMEKINN